MIEVNSNALFLSTFGVKIDVKNERKRVSRMCENAYLSIKNPKASRTLKRALDPGHRLLASLARLCFATSAIFGLRSWGPPLTKSWIRTWTFENMTLNGIGIKGLCLQRLFGWSRGRTTASLFSWPWQVKSHPLSVVGLEVGVFP